MNKHTCIVADTSPLIIFSRVNQLDLLCKLYNTIIIPTSVAEECLSDPSRLGAAAIQQAIDREIVKIVPDAPMVELKGLLDILGKGEAAAINLAHTTNSMLLIDEKLGRTTAQKLKLKIIGTAGTLLLAKQQNLIEKIYPIITALKACNYYLSEELIKEVLTRAQEYS